MLASIMVQSPPSDQNAVDLFAGIWACDLSELRPGLTSGIAPLFRQDKRPRQLNEALRAAGRDLYDMSILEIGPLEAAHTFQLEALGARSILAIEANTQAYLKCLIVKEIAKLTRSRFLLGDSFPFLKETSQRFDLVFCSGVLYHIADPFEFIQAACRVSDLFYAWTHFYDPDHMPANVEATRTPVVVSKRDGNITYHQRNYNLVAGSTATFLGGNQDISSWLSLDDMHYCFSAAGFKIDIIEIDRAHANGPGITFLAQRV